MLAPEDMLLEDSGCGPCLRVTELVGDCGTALARAARREASRRNHADLRKRAHPTRFVRCTSQVREQLHAPSRAGKGNQFPGANQESMPESEEGREFGKGRGREALKQAAEPPTGGREEHQSCSGPQGSPEDFLPCTVDLGYSLGRSGVAGSCCAGPWEGCVSAAASGFGAQQLLQAISKEKDPAEGTGYAGEARGSKKPLPRSAPRTLSGELKNLLARIEVPSATLMHGARTLSEAVECKRVPRAAPAAARSAGSAKDVHAEALGPGAPALQTDGSCIHCAGNKKGCKHCKPDRWLYPVEVTSHQRPQDLHPRDTQPTGISCVLDNPCLPLGLSPFSSHLPSVSCFLLALSLHAQRRSCNGPTRYRGPLKPGRTWRKLTDCIASATPPMSSSGAEQNPTTTVALQGSSRRRSNPGCGVKPGPKRVRSQQQRGGHRTDVSKKKTVPRGHGRDVVAAEELEIGGQQFWRRQLEVIRVPSASGRSVFG